LWWAVEFGCVTHCGYYYSDHPSQHADFKYEYPFSIWYCAFAKMFFFSHAKCEFAFHLEFSINAKAKLAWIITNVTCLYATTTIYEQGIQHKSSDTQEPQRNLQTIKSS